MSDLPTAPPAAAPDAAILAAARALLDEAVALASAADGQRLLAYLRAGQLALQAKAQLGHGQWLPFLYDYYAAAERTIRQAMAVAEAIAGDAWLASRIHTAPAAWSVRRVLEYAGLSAADRREAQERGIYTDFKGTRAPIEEAPASALRHHKRVLSGNAPKPDPVAAALARSHFVPPESIALLVRQLDQKLNEYWDRLNRAAEDVVDDERAEVLAAALYDHDENVRAKMGEWKEARVSMKIRLGRM